MPSEAISLPSAQLSWIRACQQNITEQSLPGHPFASRLQNSARAQADMQAALLMLCEHDLVRGIDINWQQWDRVCQALLHARAAILAGRAFTGVRVNLHDALLTLQDVQLDQAQVAFMQLLRADNPHQPASVPLPGRLRLDTERVSALYAVIDEPVQFFSLLAQLNQLPPHAAGSDKADSTDVNVLSEVAASDVATDAESEQASEATVADIHPQERQGEPLQMPADPGDDYHVFDSSHDRLLQADELGSAYSYADFRSRVLQQEPEYELVSRRLANRLRRKLQALQRRYWLFDQEEGCLDPARLGQWVAAPAQVNPFRLEAETAFPDIALTLLLDCSGSMKGRPILLASACIDMLTQALERCGITVEVLGFTSGAWDQGPVTRAWQAAGLPDNPGRMNQLQHVVFKSFNRPWRQAKKSLGVVLDENWLRENIDGEALWWAYHRLMQRHEQRKLMVMISDGRPRDEMTAKLNGNDYLERHLLQVVSAIEQQQQAELYAIGVGHQVGRYYRNSTMIRDMRELVDVLSDRLLQLIERFAVAK